VKSAAQDDLIALSAGITGHHADVSIQSNPEAAEEQGAALSAYERGTAALDAAKRAKDMETVSRAIAEGQYRLACAEALTAGRPRPDRRPSCFFDPRHGMSVSDAHWTPTAGGPGRDVPACSACAHKLEQGIEPDMRKVEANGVPVSYVNAGFAPAYWGGYGFGPGLFTGFLLGEALSPHASFTDSYSSGGDYGGGDLGGGDFGGGDFGGGDF
jgi:ferredoxin